MLLCCYIGHNIFTRLFWDYNQWLATHNSGPNFLSNNHWTNVTPSHMCTNLHGKVLKMLGLDLCISNGFPHSSVLRNDMHFNLLKSNICILVVTCYFYYIVKWTPELQRQECEWTFIETGKLSNETAATEE